MGVAAVWFFSSVHWFASLGIGGLPAGAWLSAFSQCPSSSCPSSRTTKPQARHQGQVTETNTATQILYVSPIEVTSRHSLAGRRYPEPRTENGKPASLPVTFCSLPVPYRSGTCISYNVYAGPYRS